jgi:hypothetical protein
MREAVICVGPLRKNGYPLRSALFDVPTAAFVRGGCIDRLLGVDCWITRGIPECLLCVVKQPYTVRRLPSETGQDRPVERLVTSVRFRLNSGPSVWQTPEVDAPLPA